MKKLISILLVAVMCLSVLAISATAADPYGTVIESAHVDTAPDMTEGLPDESWGEKVITVNGKSDNAGITQYKFDTKRFGKVKQDLSFDVYTVWTDEALYFAFVSPDPDIVGAGPNWWWGDGFQMVIYPGITNVSYMNAMFGSENKEGFELYDWGCAFAADGYSCDPSDAAMDHCSIFGDVDRNVICVKFEIPFTDLCYKKGEVPEEGNVFSFSMLRMDGDVVDKAEAYHGWLEWGNFFDHTLEGMKNITVWAGNSDSTDSENTRTVTPNTVKLAAAAAKAPEEPKEQPSDWAAVEVNAAIKEGLVPAELQCNYKEGISRENLSKLLGILIDKIYDGDKSATGASFTDTKDEAVLMAANLGIINGYKQADGTFMFKPANTLKRAEMAAIINRVAKLCGQPVDIYQAEVKFTDTASHWCNGELGFAVHNGIIKGTSATMFSPENTLTTEQTIMMIYRTYGAIFLK